MEVIVPDDQLSLAIGKKGQNVRLASKLTGWKIDIKSESKMEKMYAEALETLKTIPNVGDVMARLLYNEGYRSVEDIANTDPEELARKAGISPKTVDKIVASAREMSTVPETAETASSHEGPELCLESLPGVGPKAVELFESHGLATVADIANATPEKLIEIPGVGQKRAEKLVVSARELIGSRQNG